MKHHYLEKPLSLAAALLCLGLVTGCQTHKSIAQLGGGYEEISHPVHTFLPGETPPRLSLAHLDANDRPTVIWPSLYCHNEVVNQGVAIFVADKAFLHDKDASIHPRLFAVRYPALPVDITEEVLWRWARANGKDLYKTFNRYSLATPERTGSGLVVHLEFWSGSYLEDEDWPETGDLKLDWTEVANIMRSVESKGIKDKDLRWKTPFIAEQL